MITRTPNGFALKEWEAIPTKLPSGYKFTRGEARAAVCRANGLTGKEAARELNCGVNNVRQYWQSIYFKLGCRADVVVAINKLVELGALHRLATAFLLACVTLQAVDPNPDNAVMRYRVRGRTAQTRTLRNREGQA